MEANMSDEPKKGARPPVPARAGWRAAIDGLQVREKAHTREGDAIAAARRRLPMVEVDATIPVTGQDGPVPLLDVFEGRRQLIVYYYMWPPGQLAADQCEGCTFFNGQVSELSYLHSRDVTFATFCEGPYQESIAFHDFMGWQMPWYSARDSAETLLAGRWFGMLVSSWGEGERVYETYWTTGRGTEVMAPSYGLLDMTAYGRQEGWEDSPDGWPRPPTTTAAQFRRDGRPIAQWARVAAGRSDDLSSAGAPG